MKKLYIPLFLTLLVFLTGCKNDTSQTNNDNSAIEPQQIGEVQETEKKPDIDRAAPVPHAKPKPEVPVSYNTGEIIDWFLASGLTTTDFPEYGVSITYPARCWLQDRTKTRYGFVDCHYEFIPDNYIGINEIAFKKGIYSDYFKDKFKKNNTFNKHIVNYNNIPFFTYYTKGDGEPGGLKTYQTTINNNQIIKFNIHWGFIFGDYSNIADEIFKLITIKEFKKAE